MGGAALGHGASLTRSLSMGSSNQGFAVPVHSFVKKTRLHVALIATLFAIGSMITIPVAGRADDPSDVDASGPHNIVQLQNHSDRTLRVKGHVQLGRIPGPNVGPENYAAAVNLCSSACDTLAVALQINLVNRNYSVFVPQNVAVAVNAGCDGCHAIAVAYQYNIGVDDPSNVPAGVNGLIVEMRQELVHLDARGTTLSEAIAEVNVVIAQYNDLAAYLVTAVDDQSTPAEHPLAAPTPNPTSGDSEPAASGPAPGPAPEPSPSPQESPSAIPSPS
jgi:hypothetical protein